MHIGVNVGKNCKNNETIAKFMLDFVLQNDYDSDAIQQDLEDYDDQIENEEIQKRNSNLYNICNDKDFVSSIVQFIKNHKCMCM